MKFLRSAAALLVLLPAAAFSQQARQALPLKLPPRPTSPEITSADAMTRLYVFADDSMLGRRVGHEGNVKATAYIARQIQMLGLVPAGDSGTYFQNVPVSTRVLAANQQITVDGKVFRSLTDWLPRDNADFGIQVRDFDGAPVVYGGVFGDTATMVRPELAAGKFVIFTVPPGPDGKPRWQANRAALTSYYLGARAIAVASLDAMDAASRSLLLEPSITLAGEQQQGPPGPAFLYTSTAMATALLGAAPSGLARGTAGRTAGGSMTFTSMPAPARNVVAIVPGTDPALRGQYVAIGAHNDHDGFTREPVEHDSLRAFNTVIRPGGADDQPREPTAEEATRIRAILDSLRKIRPARLDSIYNGADDDGSGSMALLEIAEAMARGKGEKPKRSILFVWHTGEERGLWGSDYFTDHPTVPRDSIVAAINIDMIGRGAANDLPGGGSGYVQLIGSRRLSRELGDLVETVGKRQPTPFRFDYQYDAEGHPQQYYCRSDHERYARYGIPVVFFTTGGHRDYHMVTDEPQYIDYDQLARVSSLIHDVAIAAANLDHRVVVDKPKPDPRARCRQ